MTANDRARLRARRLYPRAKHFQNAYMKGARAAVQGASVDACPYDPDPRKTWARSYRAAWLRGHGSVPPPAL